MRSMYVAAAGVALTGWIFAHPAEAQPQAQKEINLPIQGMTFKPFDPLIPDGLQVSPLWGDMAATANGFMVKFPAGFRSPPHIHKTSNYRAMVISGVMTNSQEGEALPIQMPAGSYWFQPGDARHITACISEVECLVYVTFDGPYNYDPK